MPDILSDVRIIDCIYMLKKNKQVIVISAGAVGLSAGSLCITEARIQ